MQRPGRPGVRFGESAELPCPLVRIELYAEYPCFAEVSYRSRLDRSRYLNNGQTGTIQPANIAGDLVQPRPQDQDHVGVLQRLNDRVSRAESNRTDIARMGVIDRREPAPCAVYGDAGSRREGGERVRCLRPDRRSSSQQSGPPGAGQQFE